MDTRGTAASEVQGALRHLRLVALLLAAAGGLGGCGAPPPGARANGETGRLWFSTAGLAADRPATVVVDVERLVPRRRQGFFDLKPEGEPVPVELSLVEARCEPSPCRVVEEPLPGPSARLLVTPGTAREVRLTVTMRDDLGALLGDTYRVRAVAPPERSPVPGDGGGAALCQ